MPALLDLRLHVGFYVRPATRDERHTMPLYRAEGSTAEPAVPRRAYAVCFADGERERVCSLHVFRHEAECRASDLFRATRMTIRLGSPLGWDDGPPQPLSHA